MGNRHQGCLPHWYEEPDGVNTPTLEHASEVGRPAHQVSEHIRSATSLCLTHRLRVYHFTSMNPCEWALFPPNDAEDSRTARRLFLESLNIFHNVSSADRRYSTDTQKATNSMLQLPSALECASRACGPSRSTQGDHQSAVASGGCVCPHFAMLSVWPRRR